MSPGLRRAALVVLALSSVPIGLWALAAPQSFYDDFPGIGRGWVALDGPYNEHLVRDVGGLNLALGFVALAALVTRSSTVARVAGGAALVFGLPHLLYHVLNLDPYDAEEAAGVVVGLVVAVAAAALAAWPAPTSSPRRRPRPRPAARS